MRKGNEVCGFIFEESVIVRILEHMEGFDAKTNALMGGRQTEICITSIF